MKSFESQSLGSPKEAPKQLEVPVMRVYEEVVFQPKKQKDGSVVYVNSDPNRKFMELRGDVKPEANAPYTVRLIQDTMPDNPQKGKLIVEMMPADEVVWEEVEQKIVAAEPAYRELMLARAQVYKMTGIQFGTWKQMNADERGHAAEKLSKAQTRLLEKIENVSRDLDVEVGLSMGNNPKSPEQRFVKFQRRNVWQALRNDRALEESIENLDAEEAELLMDLQGDVSGVSQEAIADIRLAKAEFQQKREELAKANPEAHFSLALKELRRYKEQLDRGGLVETAYVREKKADITDHLRAGAPILIHGHLGAGKTEVAIEAARAFSKKDPLIVSGSKHLSPTELYGHQILALDKVDQEEMRALSSKIEADFKQWQEQNPKGSEQDRSLAHDRILQLHLAALKSGTVSKFFMGPVYRAMEEGRVILIDEVNAIPHEILIGLNYILTRKSGDKVLVQQDSGKEITVAKGYGIVMTANLNQGTTKYVARQELDPAFLSRLYKTEYDYLPQSVDGDLSTATEHDELFDVVLAGLMDRHGNLRIPQNSPSKLWKLCQAARVTQNVFAGKEVDSAFFDQSGGSRALPYFLQESVLSLRSLQKVLGQWKQEGFRYELDYYLYQEFVAQATVPADKKYLEQLFKNRFGFFQGEAWNFDQSQAGTQTRRQAEFHAPKIPSEKGEFFDARRTVGFYKPLPSQKRTSFPEQKGI